ncbi:MAG TPA: cytochrome c [Pyrinomonadaceae bacterium]
MKNLRKVRNGLAVSMFFAGSLFITIRGHGEPQSSDPAAYYKAKCVACHGKTAEKKFDPGLPEEQLVEIVLKGKKVEKPPHMPAYGDKGVTSEQAKALVDQMKQLKAGGH